MWQRFTSDDLRVIAHYLGVLILFSSAMYVIPLVTAIVLGEWEPASRYFTTIGISLFVGTILRLFCLQPRRLNRQQALAVTGFIWIILAFIATIPLYGSGHYFSFLDALFDGVSGLTTTGATVINDLEHLSYADNMFRFMMHLLGGLGLIVVALSFGLFGKGSASLYAAEARSEHVVPNVIQTARLISKIAALFILVATVFLTFACLIGGMEPLRAFFHALWISISGFVTGGFAPTSQSIMYYHSFVIEVFLMLLMLCGAINFTLHLEVWSGKLRSFFEDLEIKTMFLWVTAVVVVFTASLATSTSFSELPSILRRGLFTIIAAVTTTGFQNVTTNEITAVFSTGALLVIAIAMAVGGGAGSTAGGIKLLRLGIIFKSIAGTIKETLSPDTAHVSVSYKHMGRTILTPDVSKEAMTIFLLYVITIGVGVMAGITAGYDALRAIFDSVAMASNGGIVTGIVSPGMPHTLEAVYIVEMLAGRLEFITFISLVVKIVASIIPNKARARA
jgi:trk system potassium uptake protein